ncbi:MAG TPA: 2Fe-2S iron-sulfur cluster-binding protein [Spirochaetales bacterium]|nr:2Fe-2S iron-sulfur cluster-binding protein [Spirochaetales bacterium]
MNISFSLNGRDIGLSANPMERLSDLLRDRLGVHSLMVDCGSGACGKCVVLLDQEAVPSCLVPAFRIRSRSVMTYEGFVETQAYALVIEHFLKSGVELCGFCDAATILAAGSLILKAQAILERESGRLGLGSGGQTETSEISEREIVETMSSVYCRCTPPRLTLDAAKSAVATVLGKGRGRAAR